jgi:4-carboxymuconolactone decarboxylase
MTRLVSKTPDELTREQREQYHRMARIRLPDEDAQYGGPLDPWIRSPEFGRRALSLAGVLLDRTSINRRTIELVILVTAHYWKCEFEWDGHSRMARESGVSEEVIEAIRRGTRPVMAKEDELLAFDVCQTLQDGQTLSEGLYGQAVHQFGEQGVAELVGTIGFYTMVAMTLCAFGIQGKEKEKSVFLLAD